MSTKFRAEFIGAVEPGAVFMERGIATHEGHEFASGGAFVADDRLVAYLGGVTTVTNYCRGKLDSGNVVTWKGVIIGRYSIVKSWKVPCRHMGWYSMSQVSIVLNDGRRYHGRSQGPGMIVKARRIAADRRTK